MWTQPWTATRTAAFGELDMSAKWGCRAFNRGPPRARRGGWRWRKACPATESRRWALRGDGPRGQKAAFSSMRWTSFGYPAARGSSSPIPERAGRRDGRGYPSVYDVEATSQEPATRRGCFIERAEERFVQATRLDAAQSHKSITVFSGGRRKRYTVKDGLQPGRWDWWRVSKLLFYPANFVRFVCPTRPLAQARMRTPRGSTPVVHKERKKPTFRGRETPMGRSRAPVSRHRL
jgi:hypothetical protein